jgi:transcriptional regulator with XRE-family HTH domain
MTQPLEPHEVIAARVKELRTGRGWSAQRLSEELGKVGLRWDRSIVANFESRRRKYVTIDELFALSKVFSIAPVHLLVPTDAEATPYRVVPESEPAEAWTVRSWIRGESPLEGVDDKLYYTQVPDDEWNPPAEVEAGEWPPVAQLAALRRQVVEGNARLKAEIADLTAKLGADLDRQDESDGR